MPLRVEHLGEAVGLADQVRFASGEVRLLLADDGGEFVGARAEAGVDRRFGLVLELQVDEDAGPGQHHGDHRGEDEGEAEADREAAQRPPSFRSR